jgi:hypothetical protein
MRPSHNIGAEYTMVYSIRDVTRGQTPVMGAVIYFNIFIKMKKLLFLLMIITILSSCEMERKLYVHRHSWSQSYRAHRYYVPKQYKKYEAPSRVYRNRNF